MLNNGSNSCEEGMDIDIVMDNEENVLPLNTMYVWPCIHLYK